MGILLITWCRKWARERGAASDLLIFGPVDVAGKTASKYNSYKLKILMSLSVLYYKFYMKSEYHLVVSYVIVGMIFNNKI